MACFRNLRCTVEVREATKYVRGSDIYRSTDNQSVTKYASKQTKIWESEVEVVASEKKIPITLHFVSMPVMPSSS